MVRARLSPGRTHRQRVLADRNRNAELRAEFLANGLHRGVERRILARHAAGRHPVGRQAHVAECADVGSDDVGDRLGYRQTRGRRRVEQRRGCAPSAIASPFRCQ